MRSRWHARVGPLWPGVTAAVCHPSLDSGVCLASVSVVAVVHAKRDDDTQAGIEAACGAADGGGTSKVDDKLKNCSVTSMVSNSVVDSGAIAVACKGGPVVAWGDSRSMLRLLMDRICSVFGVCRSALLLCITSRILARPSPEPPKMILVPEGWHAPANAGRDERSGLCWRCKPSQN